MTLNSKKIAAMKEIKNVFYSRIGKSVVITTCTTKQEQPDAMGDAVAHTGHMLYKTGATIT
jgi:hypothetical protein